jgi:hypothetical protein
MKYQEALNEKNLTKDKLAKQTQKKIEELENLNTYIKEVEGDVEDFDDEDKKNFEDIKNKITTLDNQLEKSILKFDLEVYERRLQVFESNRIKGGIQKEPKIEKNIVEMSQEVEDEVEEDEVEEKVVEQKVEVVTKTTQPKKASDINEKLNQLKKQVSIDTNKFKQEVQEEEVEEVEEFEKKAEVKPKKNSVWYWVIGGGVLILTYGAVNLMKERR